MEINGFQAKWSILWPHPWHSLFKWSHIVHKGAYWNSKQCCLRKFSFSLDEKTIFHFSSAQKELFLWRTFQIIVAKLDQIIFIKYYDIFNAELTKWLGVKKNYPPLVKKTNFRRFSWKRVKFELQLPRSLLFIVFSKIISRYISIYLIRETPNKFQDSTTS